MVWGRQPALRGGRVEEQPVWELLTYNTSWEGDGEKVVASGLRANSVEKGPTTKDSWSWLGGEGVVERSISVSIVYVCQQNHYFESSSLSTFFFRLALTSQCLTKKLLK
jgi:hypothetical protein